MITGIFTLIGVLIGFYLGRFDNVNAKIKETISKQKPQENAGAFIIEPDDYRVSVSEEEKEEAEKNRAIDEIIKKSA